MTSEIVAFTIRKLIVPRMFYNGPSPMVIILCSALHFAGMMVNTTYSKTMVGMYMHGRLRVVMVAKVTGAVVLTPTANAFGSAHIVCSRMWGLLKSSF